MLRSQIKAMIRRKPTRIELKQEDINEFDQLKVNQEIGQEKTAAQQEALEKSTLGVMDRISRDQRIRGGNRR